MSKQIKKMFELAGPFKVDLIIATIALLTLTAVNIISPLVLRAFTNVLQNNKDALTYEQKVMNSLIFYGVLLTITYFIRAFFRFLASYMPHRAAWRMVPKLRADLYNHLQNLPVSFFTNQQTGQLMSRIVNDTDKFETMIAHIIPDTLVSILTFISVVGVLLTIQPLLTLLVFIPVPFIVVGGYIFTKKVRPAFNNAQKNLGNFNGSLAENISGVKEIQSFGQQEKEYEKVSALSHLYSKEILKALRYSAIFHSMTEFITSLGTVVVVIFGGYIALTSKTFNIADIIAFLLYLSLFYQPIQTLSRILEDYQSAWAGANRVFEIMSIETNIIEKDDAVVLSNVDGKIGFENLAFSYIDEMEVLGNLNFAIQPKSFVALVGPTGVGKTTIISLIMRFYDPNSGKITIDGHDLRDVTLDSLRQNVAVVMQEIFLFNGSIEDNIRYSRPDATLHEIIDAAKIAQIHEFIMSLPDGYNTQVGERGLKLSGGQKQRLSIARAVLRKSPILILDEATSSVDAETEALIQQSINALTGQFTIIVIAHRLSTIRNADVIYVLDNGNIIESGTHDELHALNGSYKRLCDRQSV